MKSDPVIEEKRKKCIGLLMEILGYKKGVRLPSNTYSYLKQYKDTCGYDVVYETIERQRESIEWALANKQFCDDRSMVSYVFAIIQNNIMETIRLNESRAKQSRTIQPVFEEEMIVNNANKKKVKDISAYVSDD